MSSTFATAQVRTGPGAEPANSDLSTKLNDWLQMAGPAGLFRTCGSCAHMARPPETTFCKMYSMVPPVDVVLRGCDSYADELDPPF